MHYINQCLEPGRILNYKESIIRKSCDIDNTGGYHNSKQAGMIELQLTDKCNLNCFHCHFREQGDVFFYEEWLKIIADEVKPKAISLAGGGEPTLYPNFAETIEFLKSGKSNPDIGLITNGVFIPKGNWVKNISWLRVSLYSVINDNYAGKNSNVQQIVLNNIFRYMNMEDLNMLGVSLLYYNDNMVDCITLAFELFKMLQSSKRDFSKFNLQFKRAFVMSDPRNLQVETHIENLKLLPDIKTIQTAIKHMEALIAQNPDFGEFLETCTNSKQFQKLLTGGLKWAIEQTNPKISSPNNFSKCYAVLENRLITPDGYVYACPSIAENRDTTFAIAHVTDSDEVFREKVVKFYQCQTKWCNKRFCRHASHNELVKEYSEKGILSTYDDAILKDYFF